MSDNMNIQVIMFILHHEQLDNKHLDQLKKVYFIRYYIIAIMYFVKTDSLQNTTMNGAD